MEHGHRTLETKARDAGRRDERYFNPGQRLPSMEEAIYEPPSSSFGHRRRHTMAAIDEEPMSQAPRQTLLQHQTSVASFGASSYSFPPLRSIESRTLPPPYQQHSTPFQGPALPSSAYPLTRSAYPPTSIASLLHPITTTAP